MIETIFDFVVDTSIILAPPVLAALEVIRRNKSMKEGEVGFVYNGKKWVTWIWVACFFANIYLLFIVPLFKPGVSCAPDWQFLKPLFMSIVFYLSYTLVSYRPATAQEIQEAKSTGENVLDYTKNATQSTFGILMSTLLGVLGVMPTILYHTLNPVLAIKEINGVLYQVVGGLPTIAGGLMALCIVVMFVVITIYVASAFIVFAGMISLAVITIVKYFMNKRKYAKIEGKV